MVEKMNPEKSDLTVKPKRHTYISPSTYFFRHSDDTVGFARIENGEVGPVKIWKAESQRNPKINLETLETLTLNPKP
jgi:hypothetical protein